MKNDVMTRDVEFPVGKHYNAAIQSAPITYSRIPYVPTSFSKLLDPGTARANCAPSTTAPNGTEWWTAKHKDKTVIAQHAAYWDRDEDGIIWPLDTYRGCRNFGWGIILSAVAAYLINVGLSYPTVPGILPDPYFRIWVDRLHKSKHGSDSGSFDNEGRFRPQQFEDLFAKYDHGNKGGLDAGDLWEAIKGQRLVFDFFGWTASSLEWLATYLLIWPDDGILRKEDVRGVFDGSLFQKKADEHAAKQTRKKES